MIYSIDIKKYIQYFADNPTSIIKQNKNRVFYKLKLINNVSLKSEISDALGHKLKVNYKLNQFFSYIK